MIWRYRRYTIVPERVEVFNDFFLEHLLPVQQRHGAVLVGRWQSEDRAQIVVIWAYASKEQYQVIQRQVATDPQSVEAQRLRHKMPQSLFLSLEEWFMQTTVPLDQTALAHLAESLSS